MSSEDELERLLREGRRALPEPDAEVTRRAREGAHAAVRRRRRRRVRVAALLGSALAIALGAGLGLGTFVGPTVTAAEGEVGIGFLPEPGWSALQAPARSPADQQAVTMAANVPFASEDVVNGLAEPSALPYATLLELPPRGIVIVASFIATDEYPPGMLSYPVSGQPLRVRHATPYVELATAIRPDQPLGQYALRAAVDGWNIDVAIYFGTPRPSRHQLALAQRQLDGLVIRPAPSTRRSRAAREVRPSAPARLSVVDRTFTCTPGYIGGAYTVETRVHDGSGRRGSTWESPAFAAIATSAAGAAQTAVENYIAWISGGEPSRTASVTPTFGSWTFPFRTWGTVAVNLDLCRRSSERVPLSARGLEARGVGVFDNPYDCVTPRRVLLRVRARVREPGRLTGYRSYLRTTQPAKTAEIAVRTPTGKPVAYAQVLDSGTARLHTARGCVDD